ncbi:hypothetical protein AAHA92_14286 [Salvia divinorum]|uniref:Wall-associated receptor kinase galacturonan-binding domain-containing protein n=1 Tax=Salvia divinorum TaxID=28513 RepID=A0ABD1HB17_SALDI
MKVSIIVLVLSLLSYGITLTMSLISLARPNCDRMCGNVTIPYPFGVGSDCSANASFTIICRNTKTPFLSSIKMEVLNISMLGTVIVNQPVSSPMNCSANLSTGHLPISLKGSPFTISTRYNTLAVSGCKNSVWLQANETNIIGGCTSMCAANSKETSCNGVNCCQITLPSRRFQELEYKYKTTEASNDIDSPCGYAILVEKIWLTNYYKSFKELERGLGFAPLVLEWEFGDLKGYSNSVCTYADDYCLSYPDDFGQRYNDANEICLWKQFQDECGLYPSYFEPRDCGSPSDIALYSYNTKYEYMHSAYYEGYDYASSTKYCSCPHGEGERQEIMAVAQLARRCLHLNGKRRPTMKKVAAGLEAITEVEECSYVQDRDGDSRDFHSMSIDIPESISFSSIAPFSPEPEYP